jgi:hypothetical protein
MLISHKHKFIFVKNYKSAGTSVEEYFRKFIVPEGINPWYRTGSGKKIKLVFKDGIIGPYDTNKKQGITDDVEWFAYHMPAQEIYNKIGEQTWNNYFKFSIIRNPFDFLISNYFWSRYKSLSKKEKKNYSRLLSELDIDQEAINFKTYVKYMYSVFQVNKTIFGQDICMVNNAYSMDDVIRFETLEQDIVRISNTLKLPIDLKSLPNKKGNIRPREATLEKMYDNETQALAQVMYAPTFMRFGYTFSE